MSGINRVHPQLLQAVCVVVASVALQVHWVSNGHAFQSPLVAFASFLNMGNKLVLLNVLVRLAVELEIGLELSGVVAQLALVRFAHHCAPLLLRQAALGPHVDAKHIQVVSGEAVAHGALEEFERGVAGL